MVSIRASNVKLKLQFKNLKTQGLYPKCYNEIIPDGKKSRKIRLNFDSSRTIPILSSYSSRLLLELSVL